MKKYDSIMNRVRFIEEKYGIKYAKPDGRLYGTLKVIYTILFIYTMGINILFLLGILLSKSGTDSFSDYIPALITVGSCTAAMILGFVLICVKLRLAGGIITVAASAFLIPVFSTMMKPSDTLGFMGHTVSFYWRHFAPLVLIALLVIWLVVIALRAKYKTDGQYKRITENLYNQYHGEYTSISDEQWDEFLKNYDPRDYKRQFADNKAKEDNVNGKE